MLMNKSFTFGKQKRNLIEPTPFYFRTILVSFYFSAENLWKVSKIYSWDAPSINVVALLSGIKLNHDAWMDAHDDQCRLI